VEFIDNKERALADALRAWVSDARSFKAAAPYLSMEGVEVFAPSSLRDHDTQIITGPCCEWGAVEKAAELGAQVRISTVRFHLKLYLFELRDGTPITVVGSSNFTGAGFCGNLEANVVLRGDDCRECAAAARNRFGELWRDQRSRPWNQVPESERGRMGDLWSRYQALARECEDLRKAMGRRLFGRPPTEREKELLPEEVEWAFSKPEEFARALECEYGQGGPPNEDYRMRYASKECTDHRTYRDVWKVLVELLRKPGISERRKGHGRGWQECDLEVRGSVVHVLRLAAGLKDRCCWVEEPRVYACYFPPRENLKVDAANVRVYFNWDCWRGVSQGGRPPRGHTTSPSARTPAARTPRTGGRSR